MSSPLEFLIVAAIGLLFLGSCMLWCLAVVRRVHGEPVLPWNPVARHPRLFAGVAASAVLYLGATYLAVGAIVPPRSQAQTPLSAAGEDTEAAERHHWEPIDPRAREIEELERTRSVAVASCAAGLSATIAILLLLPQLSIEPRRLQDFGVSIHAFNGQLKDGLWGFGAAVAPVAIVLAATFWLRTDATKHSFLKLLAADARISTVLIITLAAVIAAPLIEELIFRVVIQGWLQTKLRPAAAIGIVSVLFAAVHGFPDSLVLVPLAVVLGIVYYRRYSYVAVVVAHMLFNATNVILALLIEIASGEVGADGVAACLGAIPW
ncbi:MAG: hypothetical protein CMJ48_03130 [Planctomycetaceae bacterium]|nr:hypothetical protein [Planctomycetaceae bacterium]